jgi:hypothetical protein
MKGLIAVSERCDLYYWLGKSFHDDSDSENSDKWFLAGLLCAAGERIPAFDDASSMTAPVTLEPLPFTLVQGNDCSASVCGAMGKRASSAFDHDPLAVAGARCTVAHALPSYVCVTVCMRQNW